MTWVKLTDTFAINPRWDPLSVEAFATHVAALCDCAQKKTDGHLTTKAVRRLPIVEEPEKAAVELVAAGIWEATETGFQIVDYLADQEASVDIEERQAAKRLYDQEFQRDRRRAGRVGMRVDEWRASQAKESGQSVAQWLEAQRESRTTSYDVVVSRPDPTRPVPTRKGRGGEGAGDGSPEGSPTPAAGEESYPGRWEGEFYVLVDDKKLYVEVWVIDDEENEFPEHPSAKWVGCTFTENPDDEDAGRRLMARTSQYVELALGSPSAAAEVGPVLRGMTMQGDGVDLWVHEADAPTWAARFRSAVETAAMEVTS